jgi:hypothetical protein
LLEVKIMAGTFTHFMVCHMAKRDALLDSLLRGILNANTGFLLLGAVSPDLPYLAPHGTINWANVMHYEKTNAIVITGHDVLKNEWQSRTPVHEAILAWLMGYVSHLIADAAIHPVVQEIVGPYSDETKKEHRICEMTEDAFIFKECTELEIRGAEFADTLQNCGNSSRYEEVMDFWKGNLMANFWSKGEEPHPKLWYEAYSRLIDVSDGGSLAYACRHIGFESFVYKSTDEIVSHDQISHEKYYLKVKLPAGTGIGSFENVFFEKAVKNVVLAWKKLYDGLTSYTEVASYVRDCHLDTGVVMDSPQKEVYYWA